MTLGEQKVLWERFVGRQGALISSKGDDYANDDRLSNFKKVGEILGMDSRDVCLVLICTKLVRVLNLLKKGEIKHESLEDTFIDMCNYIFLLHCLGHESNKE